MARYDLKIDCKGVADITPIGYEMIIGIQEVDVSFLSDIDGKDIVANCGDIDDVLDALDDDIIIAYLEKNGYEVKDQ